MTRFMTRGAALGALLAATACGGGGSDTGDSSPAEQEPTGAAPATGGDSADDTGATPAPAAPAADMIDHVPKAAGISPLGLGIATVQGLTPGSISDPATEVGPCGAALPALVLDEAAGRRYDTPAGLIVAIALPRGVEYDAHVAAAVADLTAGCTTVTAPSIEGAEFTLGPPEAVELTLTGVEGTAWLAPVTAPSPELKSATIMLASADTAVVITMEIADKLDAALVQQMAEIGAEYLTA
jgi:hypothetical protein